MGTRKLINSYWDTPWKAGNNLSRMMLTPFSRWLFFKNGIPWRERWRIYGMPLILKHRQSEILIGPGLNLRSTLKSNPLGPNHRVILCTWQAGARIEIGANFAMTGGVICSAGEIRIGNNVIIGANSTLVDTDFHPLNAQVRKDFPQLGQCKPVDIHNDVFVGMNCIILKGVVIGAGSIIGAGSVVTAEIPEGVIAAGNPARVVGSVPD